MERIYWYRLAKPMCVFETDLHEVIWHFATDRVNISVKEAIQNGILFLSHT